jgi:putative membrane protein
VSSGVGKVEPADTADGAGAPDDAGRALGHTPASPVDVARAPRRAPPSTFGKGLAMGVADAVPGISGGTMAFLLGIHPRLVAAIAGLHPSLLAQLAGPQRDNAWRAADLRFLSLVGLGIVAGLLAGAKGIERLLEHYPIPLMALLLGLVAASVRSPARVPNWNRTDLIWAGAMALFAFIIAVVPSAAAPTGMWFLPIAGAIAACAMILPGISGSYLLVLMGLYATVIGAVAQLDLLVIALVGVGAIAGLLWFSRGLSNLLHKYRGVTHAAMVGLLAGSLIRLWPWRDAAGFAAGQPVLPDSFESVVWILAGAMAGLLLDRVGHASASQKE